MDFFSFFSLPRKLQVDVPALEKQFYAMSRRLHPDRFAARPVGEQEAALAQASLLNDAYRTLREPIARTEYLLTAGGGGVGGAVAAGDRCGAGGGTAKKQLIPPELLEEVFELNMQLQEMRMAKEMGDEEDAQLRRDLLAAQTNFQGMLAGIQGELEGLWADWDAATDAGDGAGKEKAKGAMVVLLNRRSYVRNLVRDVGEALG